MTITYEDLKWRLSLSLEEKILLTKERIQEWYEHWNGQVYVAFSGGKDSTVLLHLVRSMYPEVPAVFCDTGLEYPEIKEFVRNTPNVTILRPKLTFRQVLDKYGYPVVSKEVSQKIREAKTTKSAKLLHKRLRGDNNRYKSGKIPDKWKFLIDAPFDVSHKCCDVMKKSPARVYEKQTGRKPMLGEMVGEAHARKQKYLKNGGCNAFLSRRPVSMPIAFWTDEDVWEYARLNGIEFAAIYSQGFDRTGCVYCLFGCHMEKPGKTRFDRMKITHPKLYEYCMNKLGIAKVLQYIDEHTNHDFSSLWKDDAS